MQMRRQQIKIRRAAISFNGNQAGYSINFPNGSEICFMRLKYEGIQNILEIALEYNIKTTEASAC